MSVEIGGVAKPEIFSHTMVAASTGTTPVFGTTTTNVSNYWRFQQFLFWRWDFLQSGAGTTGTGTILFPLPAGLTIDVAKYGINNAESTCAIVGPWKKEASTSKFSGHVHVYDSTNLYASGMDAANVTAIMTVSQVAYGASDLSMSFFAQWVPIVEWS